MKFDKSELEKKIREATNLDNEDKSNLLQLLREKKTYGLVWEYSTEDAWEELKTKIPVIREVEDKQILKDTADEKYPNHILIEGENLLAIEALSYTHAGMIDVMYLDPPYNTGNKDFVYNDSYIDIEDSYRHSKWLSFMEKRLKIAKTLLSEKGVVFISIDDNEQANLKLLCDEIFGANNFLAQLIWERAYSPVNLKKHFSESHDYIIVYAKHVENAVNNGLPRTTEANERYSNPDNDVRGLWKSGDLSVGPAVESNIYPITTPSGRVVLPPSGYSWRLAEPKFLEYVADNRIWFGPEGNNVPSIKRFLSEVKQGITPMTIWKYSDVGHSQDATKELKDIFDGKALFTYPKSVRLIKRIIQLYSNPSSIILDFFAGSGTTMHATMQLNAEDGGHRQCILVTNNENNICEEVTYERNKRVIEGYTTPKGEKVAGLTKNNLRYYKVEMVEREQNHQKNKELVYGLKDLLCIKDNIYKESSQFGTLSLRGKEKMIRCFTDNEQQMLMVYDSRVIPYLVKEIEEMEQKVKIYLFADGAYPYTQDFQTVLDKVDLIPLPYAYHRSIKDVLPDDAPIKVDDTELSSEEQKEMMAEAIEAENKENMEG